MKYRYPDRQRLDDGDRYTDNCRDRFMGRDRYAESKRDRYPGRDRHTVRDICICMLVAKTFE